MTSEDKTGCLIAAVVCGSVLLFFSGMFAGGWIVSNSDVTVYELEQEAVSRGYAQFERGKGDKAIFRWKEAPDAR